MIDKEDLLDRQDRFLSDIVEEYGVQSFFVNSMELPIVLSELHYLLELHGLREYVPIVMESEFDASLPEGNVEVLVCWFDTDRYLVGVYPIFPGE